MFGADVATVNDAHGENYHHTVLNILVQICLCSVNWKLFGVSIASNFIQLLIIVQFVNLHNCNTLQQYTHTPLTYTHNHTHTHVPLTYTHTTHTHTHPCNHMHNHINTLKTSTQLVKIMISGNLAARSVDTLFCL